MTPNELTEELLEARARVGHLEQSIKGALRWVDKLLRHCKTNGVPVDAKDFLGQDGWIVNNPKPFRTMLKCEHINPKAVNIYAGEGIEWCSECGAFRQVSFTTTKNGEWHLPKQPPRYAVKSNLSLKP